MTDGRGAERIGEVMREYRLLRVIGAGGMGVVYAAEHVRLKRRAAVKLLAPEVATDRKVLGRFFAEARVVAALSHPNVVDVYDLDETGATPCIVMELLRGRSLAEVLADEGPLAPARAAVLVDQVLAALVTAHEQGVVHRDIKPHNLFLVEDEVHVDFVKVLDFGIAKLSEAGAYGVSRTATGAMIGTPQYMAPEQIEGHAVDGRTDLYAVGTVLYELVTGTPPFTGPTLAALLSHHLLDAAPPLRARCPDAPPALEAFVARCLAKRKEERFASALDARRALGVAPVRRSGGHAAVPAVPTPPSGATLSTLRGAAGEAAPAPRHRFVYGGMAAALAVVATVGVAHLVSGRRAPPPAAPQVMLAPPIVTVVHTAPPAASQPAPECRVRIESTPAAAQVTVDGRPLGVTPAVLAPAPCGVAVDVLIEKPGYLPWRGRAVPDADVAATLRRKRPEPAAAPSRASDADLLDR